MATHSNEKQTSTPLVNFIPIFQNFYRVYQEIQIITQHWIRILNIKLGWIHDFDKLVVNYVMFFYFYFHLITNVYLFITQVRKFFMLDVFRLSSKLLNTFAGHTGNVWSIDYSTFGDDQFICSGSHDKTIRVWDVDNNKQIQSFDGHSNIVICVKFSQYYYYNYRLNVICFSSKDKTIRFWDFKNDQQLQVLDGHTGWIGGIEFSSFNNGRYLCSGSFDKTIRLWDVETSKLLHIFGEHKHCVRSVDISPLQSNNNKKNNNDDKNNIINLIGGNGYTICSGSYDRTIRICDIETTKQLLLIKGHENFVMSVKYGSNELVNTILSGSHDKSVRLWDIRSGQQTQVFNGHTNTVWAVEYSPFIVNNIEANCNSNIICSGSADSTIRFWDIRSNKKELYMIDGDKTEDNGISCFKFLLLKKKGRNNEKINNCGINLCYGSYNGPIRVWG
ncbi:hypothetical protein RFI_20562 [Reticulomyxa filosa]|uniref:Uncharacterized protein n=1 Tax=Reticulomyxa filosa TaxID=46433 RepID=X6MTJ3_RETFI|nr:hypothetical protein RFI_20562 [Reticulomyxa filosa]|eukprot:ETO16777.1 hypothetical protein RFI_20562 [Reticulomyxa filosa]